MAVTASLFNCQWGQKDDAANSSVGRMNRDSILFTIFLLPQHFQLIFEGVGCQILSK